MCGCLRDPELRDCDRLPPGAVGCVDAGPAPDGAGDADAGDAGVDG